MANYLLAYHGGMDMSTATAEQQKASMDAWMSWFGGLGDAVVDGGNPAGAWRTVAASGVTNDGGANPVTGYSLIKADSIEAATKIAQGCPILTVGGSVEVAETFNAM